MNDQGVREEVYFALLNAIAPVMDAIHESGDQEAMSKIAPTLLVLGTTLMVQNMGRDVTAEVIQSLVERIQRGDFDTLL